ncbi:MAG: hypothetical protein E6344_00125 [Clostridium sp.]|uniref:hypothetical protein n=1 Tax=Clostridium culturomicium TaxID=1499683 RepID=UPI002908E4E6|nr:hypothetical protein [Clostridium sp.]MDU7082070.1 hypothetical protein [Clostridium sp.]
MSDYQDFFGMFGGPGACPPPPPPGPGPCPGPGPVPGPGLGGFGGNSIIIWIIILFFLCRGGFGFGNNACGNGCGNNGCGCGGNDGCGCGNNGYAPMMPAYQTGCCTTMMPNPCDYTEYCNCCGKQVKKCKKQKNYIVEMCQCGGNLPAANNNCGCGNYGGGFGCGNGFGIWWIIILIILFCFRGGNGFLGGAPCPPGPPPASNPC